MELIKEKQNIISSVGQAANEKYGISFEFDQDTILSNQNSVKQLDTKGIILHFRYQITQFV